jgi:hypothetical protein
MDSTRRPIGIVTLASEAMRQTADLVQTELRLARAEIAEKLTTLLAGTGIVLAGAVFLMAALVLLLHGVVAVLMENRVSPGLAFTIVAVLSAAVGVVLVFVGRGRVANVEIVPERTIGQLEQDVRMAKEKVS